MGQLLVAVCINLETGGSTEWYRLAVRGKSKIRRLNRCTSRNTGKSPSKRKYLSKSIAVGQRLLYDLILAWLVVVVICG